MEALPTTLKDIVALGMGAGGVWLSVKVMSWIDKSNWTADRCIYTGMGIAGGIGILVWLFGGGVMGYFDLPPVTGDYWYRAWIEILVSVGLTTAVLAKVYYDGIYHPLEKRAIERAAKAGLV